MARAMISRTVAIATAAALGGAGLVGAAAASPPQAATAAPEVALQQPDESVQQRPGVVVGDALDPGQSDQKAWVAAFQQDADGTARVVTERVNDHAEAVAAVRELQGDDATTAVSVADRVQVATNDPQYAQQWAMPALQLPTAWLHSRGAGITVAVVDTGADTTHPDLAGNLVQGADVIGSVVSSTMTDPHGHGTHVSGTIAAVTDNAVGVAGVAPLTKVMPVRVLNANGSGYTSDVAEGIVYAADHGASVINLSLGGSVDDPVQRQAVAYAQSKDVLVVAAAGNARASGNAANYPAAIASVTAVAATDSANVDASFSNFGSYVDIAAPGVGIRSTLPGATYASWSGTSMATPHVVGVAALIRSQRPTLTQAQVGALLTSTATDLKTTGWDAYTGSGLVNPVAALASGATASPTTSPSITPTGTPTVTPTSGPTSSAPATPTASPTLTAAPTPSATRTTPAPAPTQIAVPGAVTAMSVRIARRTATLTWSPASGSVRGYRMRVGKQINGRPAYGTWTTTTARFASFPISAGTWTVQVYAFNSRGNGPTVTGSFSVRAVASLVPKARSGPQAKSSKSAKARAKARVKAAKARQRAAKMRTYRVTSGVTSAVAP